MTEKRSELADIYEHSGIQNLRILQQTMWDFERFFPALTPQQQGHDSAVTAVLRLFFALSFELKAGRIEEEDLRSRLDKFVSGMMARRENGDRTPLAIADARYPGVQLHNSILSDSVLVDVLAKGIIDEQEIRSCLERSGYFFASQEEPAWRTIWHAFERTDEEVDSALAEMERQFASREIGVVGEILHVFGLRLWLSDVRVLGLTRAQVVEEGRRYIDDLYSADRLEAATPEDLEEFSISGYGGLGIHENRTIEFGELFTYMNEKRQAAAERRYPEMASELMQELEADPALFFRRVSFNNSEDSRYPRVPLLTAIAPSEFASVILRQHPSNQRVVMNALKARYEGKILERELAPEKPWLVAVRTELVRLASDLSPLGRDRVEKFIESNIAPVLREE